MATTNFTPSAYLAALDAEFAKNPVGGSKYFQYLGYGASSAAHCCAGPSYIFKAIFGKNIVGINTVEIKAALLAAGGKIIANRWSDDAQPGDILLMHWNLNTDLHSTLDHCATLEKVTSSTTIQCKEFNGNSSRENKAFARYKANVAYVIRPPWDSNPVAGYTGWIEKGDKRYHYTNGKLDYNKWFKGTGGWSDWWFYVGEEGYSLTNQWIYDDGEWFYLNEIGAVITDEWAKGAGKYAGKYFYCGEDGWPLKNTWAKGTDGKWRYLGEDGAMIADAVKEIGGKLYHFQKDGTVQASGKLTLTAYTDGTLHL